MLHSNTTSKNTIILNMDESGVARLVFQSDRRAFTGILVTNNGETISINGKVVEGSPETHTHSEPYIMDILIVDGETGSTFKLSCVQVFVDDQQVSIENPAIKFSTEQKLIGVKAVMAIQQYMQPDKTYEQTEVFVGPMRLLLLASENPPQSIRHESTCEGEAPTILEHSNDFFA